MKHILVIAGVIFFSCLQSCSKNDSETENYAIVYDSTYFFYGFDFVELGDSVKYADGYHYDQLYHSGLIRYIDYIDSVCVYPIQYVEYLNQFDTFFATILRDSVYSRDFVKWIKNNINTFCGTIEYSNAAIDKRINIKLMSFDDFRREYNYYLYPYNNASPNLFSVYNKLDSVMTEQVFYRYHFSKYYVLCYSFREKSIDGSKKE